MSDYTPTTEEVKANYSLVGDDEVVNTINEQKFDRWLEQNNAEVAKSTEQRIIKLLQGMDVYPTAFDLEIKDLIALIKGEQNPYVRAETRATTVLNTANIVNSACSCGCKGDNK